MTRGYVEKKLLEIGMPASCKGFGYIVDAVMVLHNPEWKCDKMMAIYQTMASKNKTSSANVEHCMRTAFATSRNEGGENIEKYFGKYHMGNKNTLFTFFRMLSIEKGGIGK